MRTFKLLDTFLLLILVFCYSQLTGQTTNAEITKDTILISGHQFVKNSTPSENKDAHYENWTALDKGVEKKLRSMLAKNKKVPLTKHRSNQCLEWILDYYAVNATEAAQFQAHLDQHIYVLTEALNDLFGKTNTGQAVNWTINPQVINLNLSTYPSSFGRANEQVVLYMYNNNIDPDVHFGVAFTPQHLPERSGAGAALQGGATALGKTWRIGAWNDIDRLLVSFHEIGHSLNFVHTNGSGCIMEGSAVRDTCFTQYTINIFNTTVTDHWGDFSNGSCSTCTDQDNDNICDPDDNCPTIANENQMDVDNDGKGIACDCDDSTETGSTCFENCTTFYQDQDGDGFGNPSVSVTTCVAPDGYVANNMDECPDDINKKEAGDCGCGTPETDCVVVDCSVNLQSIVAISVDSLVQGRNIEANDEIANGATVNLKAGTSIILKEGFHAMEGSVFTAKIGTCVESEAMPTPNLLERSANNKELSLNPLSLKIFPNPFPSQTTIQYFLPKSNNVTLQVFDLLGKRVTTLIRNEQQTKGWHQTQFNASAYKAGTYFMVLTNREQRQVEKIILL